MSKKVVRDDVPRRVARDSERPLPAEVIPDAQFAPFLRRKLVEEVRELLATDEDHENYIEELVDVVEVLFALAERAGIDEEGLNAARTAKAAVLGRFEKRYVMEWDDH